MIEAIKRIVVTSAFIMAWVIVLGFVR